MMAFAINTSEVALYRVRVGPAESGRSGGIQGPFGCSIPVRKGASSYRLRLHLGLLPVSDLAPQPSVA